MSKSYYEGIYSRNKDESWNKAPGKNVIISAIQYYYEKKKITGNAKIVDIGCGSGYLLDKILSVNNKFQCYGVDFSLEAIKKSRKHYPQCYFFCEDGANTHFCDKEFDVLISYGTYEHFSEPKIGIMEASRILRDGGYFFCMMPTLGVDRTDRDDEGWYKERVLQGATVEQMQWNLKYDTWKSYFVDANLRLFPRNELVAFGALKPSVFFFGRKINAR